MADGAYLGVELRRRNPSRLSRPCEKVAASLRQTKKPAANSDWMQRAFVLWR